MVWPVIPLSGGSSDGQACGCRCRGCCGSRAGIAVARSQGSTGARAHVLALRAHARRQAGAALQRAARHQRIALAHRPPPGVAGRGAAAAARIPRPPLRGQRGLEGRREPRRPHAARAPRRLARPVRGRHAVLLPRRVREGPAQGPALGAGRHARLAHACAAQAVHAGREEHRCARGPAAAQQGRARAAAVRHARALPARPALAAGRVQGQQRARGLCRDRRHRGRERERGRRGAARRLAARAHRAGREPDLRTQHHRPRRPDEGQREAAAGADARVPRPQRADGRVHAALGQERAAAQRLLLRRRGGARARHAAARRGRAQGARRERAALRPARHRQDRTRQGGGAGRGARAVRGRVRGPRRQLAVGPRPLPLAADRAGLPQGQCPGRAAVRRGRGRVPADQHRGRAVHGARRTDSRAGQRQRQRQGLGQPDPRGQPGAHAVGHQPHRADRSRVPAPLRLPPRAQVAAAGRARAAREEDARGRDGVRGLHRQAGRAQGPDARADPHRGAFRGPGPDRRRLGRGADRTPSCAMPTSRWAPPTPVAASAAP